MLSSDYPVPCKLNLAGSLLFSPNTPLDFSHSIHLCIINLDNGYLLTSHSSPSQTLALLEPDEQGMCQRSGGGSGRQFDIGSRFKLWTRLVALLLMFLDFIFFWKPFSVTNHENSIVFKGLALKAGSSTWPLMLGPSNWLSGTRTLKVKFTWMCRSASPPLYLPTYRLCHLGVMFEENHRQTLYSVWWKSKRLRDNIKENVRPNILRNS